MKKIIVYAAVIMGASSICSARAVPLHEVPTLNICTKQQCFAKDGGYEFNLYCVQHASFAPGDFLEVMGLIRSDGSHCECPCTWEYRNGAVTKL